MQVRLMAPLAQLVSGYGDRPTLGQFQLRYDYQGDLLPDYGGYFVIQMRADGDVLHWTLNFVAERTEGCKPVRYCLGAVAQIREHPTSQYQHARHIMRQLNHFYFFAFVRICFHDIAFALFFLMFGHHLLTTLP